MKLRLAAVACGLGIVLILFLSSPFAPDAGLPFGYFGELNRVKAAVNRTSGLRIEKVMMHRDMSLEDFWVTVRTASGRTFTIEVFDGSNVRDADDRADGVMLFPKGYAKSCTTIPLGSEIWSEVEDGAPTNLDELLPRMDAFLAAVDRANLPTEKSDFEKSKRFIKLLYTIPNAP